MLIYPSYKIFNGKRYKFYDRFNTKTEANKMKIALRKYNNLVRIVKYSDSILGLKYLIYIRKPY